MKRINDNLFAERINDSYLGFWNAKSMGVAYVRFDSSIDDDNNLCKITEEMCNKNADFDKFAKEDIGITYTGNVSISQMVLLVSTRCNYNCAYCQIEKNMMDDNMVNMSYDIARKALDLFLRNSNSSSKRTLTITGGEPLLNFDVVKQIIHDAREKMSDVRIVIFTNASLVTDEIAKYFEENDVNVLVSIDGPHEIHDIVRVKHDGSGTFEDSIKGFEILKGAGCHVAISSVGGLHNYKEIDRLIELYKEYLPESVGYNIPHFLLDKDNEINISSGDFARTLIHLYKELRVRGIYLENISRIVNAFSQRIPKLNECQAQGKGFTVDPRGKIGPCKSLVINDIVSIPLSDALVIADLPIFKEWAQRSPITDSKCHNCPEQLLCGGGCAYDSYAKYDGNYMEKDRRMCEYYDIILDFLISDLFANIEDAVGDKAVYVVSPEEQEDAFMKYRSDKIKLHISIGHE